MDKQINEMIEGLSEFSKSLIYVADVVGGMRYGKYTVEQLRETVGILGEGVQMYADRINEIAAMIEASEGSNGA